MQCHALLFASSTTADDTLAALFLGADLLADWFGRAAVCALAAGVLPVVLPAVPHVFSPFLALEPTCLVFCIF